MDESTKNQMLEMLKKMLEIRYFEEKVVDQYARGAVPGLAHLYIGEEAVAVGTCMNLTDDDYITSTHGATAIASPRAAN